MDTTQFHNNDLLSMIVQYFLTNVLSPLLLPLFVMAILSMIVGAKADSLMKAYADGLLAIFGNLAKAFLAIGFYLCRWWCRLIWSVIRAGFTVWQKYLSKNAEPLPDGSSLNSKTIFDRIVIVVWLIAQVAWVIWNSENEKEKRPTGGHRGGGKTKPEEKSRVKVEVLPPR